MNELVRGAYKDMSIERLANFFSRIVGDAEARRITKEMVFNFGSLDKLFATPYEVIEKMWGSKVALYVRTVGALSSRRGTSGFEFGKPQPRSAICEYLKALLLDECVEAVKVIPLDGSGVPLCCRTATRGVVNASDVTARSIAEIAYSVGSKRVIIVHNHPRGIATPSEADVALTRGLSAALLNVGIKLEYHVVVSGTDCAIVDLADDLSN